AYHSALLPESMTEIRRIVRASLSWFRLPEMVIFLEVGRDEQLSRLKLKDDDQLQQALGRSDSFQQAVRNAYSFARECVPLRWNVIDTSNRSPEDVAKQILRFLKGVAQPKPY